MQTTSLEVSRELEKAGFWDNRKPVCWHIKDLQRSAHESELAFRPEGSVPAATLDDLIIALGLDKPWDTIYHMGRLFHKVYPDGFNCDPLARVWIELNKEKND